MNNKILVFFDKLAGYYEDLTGYSANNTGMTCIILGAMIMACGEVMAVATGNFIVAMIPLILTGACCGIAWSIYKYFTPAILRAKLHNEAVFLLWFAISQFIVIIIPGNDYALDLTLNTSSTGFIIFAFGQFFYASNPFPPERKVSFQGA